MVVVGLEVVRQKRDLLGVIQPSGGMRLQTVQTVQTVQTAILIASLFVYAEEARKQKQMQA